MSQHTHSILMLPGDGIGPEVMAQLKRIIDWLGQQRNFKASIKMGLVGGAAIDAAGTPITDETMADALAADVVLLGAVGGPKWDNLPFAQKPERGLLRLRKDLGLFANIRPAYVFDALVDASSLKPDLVRGLDIIILRELTGGVYFGEPRGIETLPDGSKRGINTQIYTTPEIDRIARVGFELAAKRRNLVHSVEKANVMESGVLWREVVSQVHAKDFAKIELQHMYADNCAMQLVRRPKQFDVIVTDNLFGDILSDCAAMLTGSLGMLPSASLGAADAKGRRRALYEPVHGSAPDIAGQNIANPLATILSFTMALRYSFNLDGLADQVENAVKTVLARGLRTADIYAAGTTKITTSAMGDAILQELAKSKA